MKKVTIYTDGSCLGNPGRGGWAAILRYEEREKELTGCEQLTTNNRMEMTAALKALEALTQPCQVVLNTDSTYLQRAFAHAWIKGWQRNGWRTAAGGAVKNQDLWKQLVDAAGLHEVRWNKVKAHASNRMNNRVDRLAKEAAKQC